MKSNPPNSLILALAIFLVPHTADFAQAAGAVPGTIPPIGNGQCVAPPAGLVGWWRGDSPSALGSEAGTFRGGGKSGVGFSGGGLEFGGSHDALILPNNFKLTGQDFSIETWIRRENSTTTSNDNEAGEFFAGSNAGFAFGLTHEGRLYLSQIGIVSFYSTTSIQDTAWHHVAVSRVGNDLSFFVDGSLNAIVHCSVSFNLDGPFAIGGLGTPYNGASYGFRGSIDELAVYSSGLSSGQIASLNAAGAEGKCLPTPVPVALANATATYSQGLVQSFPAFPVTQSIDGLVIENHNGWAVYPRQGVPETAVWETTQDAGFVGGTLLTFKIQSSGHLGHHGLGRFRLSATTDPRAEFADGQISNGDVTANWTILPVTQAASSEGTVLTLQPDGSLLASGNNPFSDIYTIETSCTLTGITGFRLEALPDASLPMGGPGRDFEGNFVLSEIEVTATPSGSTTPTPTCSPSPTGLLAWYRGDDTANDQAGPREGNFVGAQYAPGKVGRAFDFSGNNEVVIADSPEFNGATFTLAAWVNPTKLDGAVDIIVNKEAGQQFPDFQFEFGIKGPVQEVPGSIPVGNLAFFLGGVDGLPNDYGGWADGLTAIPLNQWTHVALAVEPGGVSVFVNGVETRRLTNLTGSVRSTTGALRIGSRSEGFTSARPEERFNGQIDEFCFFTRRLTQPEVAAIYNAGAGGICVVVSEDTEPPVLAVAEPAAATVTDDRFNLRGTAADNIAVTSLTWSWNGSARGSLSLSGGQFAANGLILNSGLNTFVVTASDAAGNRTSVTREVTLAALRTLRVADATEVQEGKRIRFPIVLDSPGDVGGMTFRLNYDSAYLTEPQLDWGSEVGQSVNNVNATVAGELSASFALPGTSLPTGATPVATVSFRARSVPFALATELTARIDSLSSATGASLPRGNAVVAGSGRIKPRKITADNNANQRLDIGDAVVVSRLQVGLEEQRSWDIGLNDLNGSANIDSGDIVKVLRTVVGLDSQPTPTGGSARQAVSRVAVNQNDRMVLEFPDGPVAHIGQPYSVVVKVAKAGGNLSGLSFVVDYPAALSLSARRVGGLVPAGTLPLWNSAAGTVQLAAVSPTVWPSNEGVAAVLTFVPQADFATQAAWPLQLRQIELTGSGFDVRAAEDVNAIVKSVVIPANAPKLALLPQSDGNLRLEVRAEAGFDVVVEHSANLTDWTEAQAAVGAGVTQPVTLNLSPVAEAKFWRARNR